MPVKITIPASVKEAVIASLLAQIRAFRGDKGFMPYQVAERVFDILKLCGMDVPDGTTLERDYWQTTGPIIWPGTAPIDEVSEFEAWVHEGMHNLQWWADMLRMPVWYLQHHEMRGARYESEAYLQGYAMRALLTGEVPSASDVVSGRYKHGYALPEPTVQLVTNIVDGGLTSIAKGIIPPGTARIVAKELHRRVQAFGLGVTFFDPGYLELVLTNNPEALQ